MPVEPEYYSQLPKVPGGPTDSKPPLEKSTPASGKTAEVAKDAFPKTPPSTPKPLKGRCCCSCWESFCQKLQWLCEQIKRIFCCCFKGNASAPKPPKPPTPKPPITPVVPPKPITPRPIPPVPPVPPKPPVSPDPLIWVPIDLEKLDGVPAGSLNTTPKPPLKPAIVDPLINPPKPVDGGKDSKPVEKPKPADGCTDTDDGPTKLPLVEILNDLTIPITVYHDLLEKFNYGDTKIVSQVSSFVRELQTIQELLRDLKKEKSHTKNAKIEAQFDLYRENLEGLYKTFVDRTKDNSTLIFGHIENLIKMQTKDTKPEQIEFLNIELTQCLNFLISNNIEKLQASSLLALIPKKGDVKPPVVKSPASPFLGFENPYDDFNRCYVNSSLQILFRSQTFLDALHKKPTPLLTILTQDHSQGETNAAFEARTKRIRGYDQQEHNHWLPVLDCLLAIENARNKNDFEEVSRQIGKFRRAAIDSRLNPELDMPYANQKDPSAIFQLVLTRLGLSPMSQTFEGETPTGNLDPKPVISVSVLKTEEILKADSSRVALHDLIKAVNNIPINLEECLKSEFAEYISGEPVNRGRGPEYISQKNYLMDVPDLFTIQLKRTVKVTDLYRQKIINPLIQHYMQFGMDETEAKQSAYRELRITVEHSMTKDGLVAFEFRKINNPVYIPPSWQPDLGFMIHPNKKEGRGTTASLKGVILHHSLVASSGHYTNFVKDEGGIFHCNDARVAKVEAAAYLEEARNGFMFVFERNKNPDETATGQTLTQRLSL
jgi:hypothetical protein